MLVLASIYALFFIHETKGLRIDQMDVLFGFVKPGTDYAAKAIDEEDAHAGEDPEKEGGNARVEVV